MLYCLCTHKKTKTMKKLSIGHRSGRPVALRRLWLASFVAIGLFGFISAALADSGLVTVLATVPGPPPATSATIDTPSANQSFLALPVTVSGSCASQDLIISLLDNGNFVGSTICDGSGHYSLKIDLFLGSNSLVVRELDSLNQYGPDSPALTVFYAKPTSVTTPKSSGSTTGQGTTSITSPIAQLAIVLDSHSAGFTGTQAGQPLNLSLRLSGGLAPYAVHIDWGDGNSSLLSQASNDLFTVSHTYAKGGNYQATFEASDSSGQLSTLRVAIIINGNGSSIPQRVIETTHKMPISKALVPVAAGLVTLSTGYVVGAKGLLLFRK